MNWSNWRRGLLISAFTALIQEVVLVLDPNIAWRTLVVHLVVATANGTLLYLKSNPPATETNNNEPPNDPKK